MSYCQLIAFKGGQAHGGVEFRNSWGGSARIWDALFKTYVPKKHEYDSWLANNGNDERLWALARREDLPMFERAVHAFTFDRFYVRKENFAKFANDLRLFVAKHAVIGACVDHLPAWANWLDSENGAEAVGLHGTSVSGNPWIRSKACPTCGSDTEEDEAVPLSDGYEVYDWLSSLKVAEVAS